MMMPRPLVGLNREKVEPFTRFLELRMLNWLSVEPAGMVADGRSSFYFFVRIFGREATISFSLPAQAAWPKPPALF